MDITQEDLKKVLTSMHNFLEGDLLDKTEAELEGYWFFEYNESNPLEKTIYDFHQMLGLYGRMCRRWEEAKNGSYNATERVRDKYLMPKIRQFAKQVIGGIPDAKDP